jgi:hypothetical protein
VFEEKPVIACYAKGVQVTKQSSVPNHIKGFTSIHKSEQQNKLQKGFAQGEMPIIAALILSELIAEAKSNKSPLYVAFMDARKAFDVVWHTGLFRDLYTFGITGVLSYS